jgi:hypothetical protein
MDERNDVTDIVQLLIFIHRTDATFMVHEELGSFCCLKGNCARKDLFMKVQETLASLVMSWEKLKSVIYGGKKRGSKTSVVGQICKEVVQIVSGTPAVFHCIINQETICYQMLSLKGVMDIVIPTVNYI